MANKKQSTAQVLYPKVKHVIPADQWEQLADDVEAILRLKAKKNAIILAHNYIAPEIFHGVADITGDSLSLARQAVEVDADVIVLAGVGFMAETVKLLNPEKTVLIPDPTAGCSLAESITPEDVRALKAANPGVPVVTYVNTSLAVKAESDICCTSGNAEKVITSLNADKVIMIPDQYLAANVAARVGVEVIVHPGACEVHEAITGEDIRQIRADNPGIVVLTHLECPPNVVAESDFAGSTAQMVEYIEEHQPKLVALVTETAMSDNVAQQYPDVEFARNCYRCPHMKLNTLESIRRALETMTHEVAIDPTAAEKAKLAVERMLEIK